MIMARRNMGDIRDFVRANFPEPHNPIKIQPNWDQNPGMMGLRDFVLADFPEPHNPIYNRGIRGCGAGCGCESCGMGGVEVPGFALAWPAPLNEKWGPLPVVYWGGGIIAALLVLPMVFKKGRR